MCSSEYKPNPRVPQRLTFSAVLPYDRAEIRPLKTESCNVSNEKRHIQLLHDKPYYRPLFIAQPPKIINDSMGYRGTRFSSSFTMRSTNTEMPLAHLHI